MPLLIGGQAVKRIMVGTGTDAVPAIRIMAAGVPVWSSFAQSGMFRNGDYSPSYSGYGTLGGFTADPGSTVTDGSTLVLQSAGGKIVFTGVQRWRGAGGSSATFYAQLVIDGAATTEQIKSDSGSTATPFRFEWPVTSAGPGSTVHVRVRNNNSWWNAQDFRLEHVA